MLTSKNIRLSRILRNTWKVDLFMLATCICTWLLHDNLLQFHFELPALVPTVLGTAIAFFIGFNNNQAYDRWWEARKVWGAIVNDSRSWARDAISYISSVENGQDVEVIKKKLVHRHIAWLYALKMGLRDKDDTTYLKYLSAEDAEELARHSNKHNGILALQAKDLQYLQQHGYINDFRFIQMDDMLVRFSDSMGKSERIKNTVFPTTYNYLSKVFIWLFVISVAVVTGQLMEFWSIPFSWLIGFVFVSTQINGMSLVNPFDNNPSSISLSQITRTIEINLLEMLHEKDIPEPVQPIHGEYIL